MLVATFFSGSKTKHSKVKHRLKHFLDQCRCVYPPRAHLPSSTNPKKKYLMIMLAAIVAQKQRTQQKQNWKKPGQAAPNGNQKHNGHVLVLECSGVACGRVYLMTTINMSTRTPFQKFARFFSKTLFSGAQRFDTVSGWIPLWPLTFHAAFFLAKKRCMHSPFL